MSSRRDANDLDIADDDEFAHLLADDAPEQNAPKRLAVAAGGASGVTDWAPRGAGSLLAADDAIERSLVQGLAAAAGAGSLANGGAAAESEARPPAPTGPSLSMTERREIEERLEAADRVPRPASLDAAQARRLSASVARAHQKNQLERSKHPDDPSKFLESEMALHAEVRALQDLASAPELLGEVVAAGGAEAALAVVGHPNGDVSIAALEFLDEALQAEADAGAEAEAEAELGQGRGGDRGTTATRPLAEATVRLGGCEAVVARLWELDQTGDEDDAEGCQRALSICEQMVSAPPPGVDATARLVASGLAEFVLRRLQPSRASSSSSSSSSSSAAAAATGPAGSASDVATTAVRHQAAEVLALLLQQSPAVRLSLPSLRLRTSTPADAHSAGAGGRSEPAPVSGPDDVRVDGVELLVRAAGVYRLAQRDPATAAEKECCEAVFQALSRAAAPAIPLAADSAPGDEELAIRAALTRAEAPELLVLVAQRTGLFARHCAVGALAALAGSWPGAALVALRNGVLGAVMPVIMGRAASATRLAAGRDAAAVELAAALQITHAVVKALDSGSVTASDAAAGDSNEPSPRDRLRVVAKLLERDGEKIARIVDLLRETRAKVAEAARRVRAAGPQGVEAASLGGDVEAAVDLARMNAGLEDQLRCEALVARLCDLDARVRARLLARMAALRMPGAQVATALEEATLVLGEHPAAMSRLAVLMRGFDNGPKSA